MADLRAHELDYFERRKERQSQSRRRLEIERQKIKEVAEYLTNSVQRTRLHQVLQAEHNIER